MHACVLARSGDDMASCEKSKLSKETVEQSMLRHRTIMICGEVDVCGSARSATPRTPLPHAPDSGVGAGAGGD